MKDLYISSEKKDKIIQIHSCVKEILCKNLSKSNASVSEDYDFIKECSDVKLLDLRNTNNNFSIETRQILNRMSFNTSCALDDLDIKIKSSNKEALDLSDFLNYKKQTLNLKLQITNKQDDILLIMVRIYDIEYTANPSEKDLKRKAELEKEKEQGIVEVEKLVKIYDKRKEIEGLIERQLGL